VLSDRLDPPDLVEARRWYTTAAESSGGAVQQNSGLCQQIYLTRVVRWATIE
jgi:hypothetical protein